MEVVASEKIGHSYSLRKKDIVPKKKRGPKPRALTWKMSQYKRREANAKERERQGVINTGFDKLREVIPHPGPSSGKCEKLRKIDILHVAISYIRALKNLLDTGDAGENTFSNSLFSIVSEKNIESFVKKYKDQSQEAVEEGENKIESITASPVGNKGDEKL